MPSDSERESRSDVLVDLGPIWQLGFVVRDIEAVVHRWASVGVGPWLLPLDHAEQPNLHVRGVPTLCEVSVALAYKGEVMIELIEQHNGTETAYTKAMARGDGSLHHLGYLFDDLEPLAAAFEAAGHETLMSGGAGGTQYRYYDTGPIPGVMTELVSVSPQSALLTLKDESRTGDPFEIHRP